MTNAICHDGSWGNGLKHVIYIEKDIDAFGSRLARMVAAASVQAASDHGCFNMAICGGRTPLSLFKKLAASPFNRQIDWSLTHLFWVDERCVPQDSPDSNFGNARNAWIDKVKIPKTNVHPMDGTLMPETGALAYEKVLGANPDLIWDRQPVFDLVLLGVGNDGHVASLFPENDPPEKSRWVVAVKGGRPDVWRLTLTYGVINRAAQVVFMLSGKAKSEIANHILTGKSPILPAQRIRPVSGKTAWVLDQEAAALLPENLKEETRI